MNCRQDSGDEDKDYFRANIWGMQKLRAAMEEVGVLDWDADYGEFPSYDPPEDADEEAEEAYDKEHEKRCEPIKSQGSSKPDMVPGFKFCSNDGWIVTPDECLIIAKKLLSRSTDNEKTCEDVIEENREFEREFAEYCQHAASQGGFSVW